MVTTQPEVVYKEHEEETKMENELKDLEKGETINKMQSQQHVGTETVQMNPPSDFHMSRMQRLNATNPLRLVMNNATRVASPFPSQPRHSFQSQNLQQPRSTPTPQPQHQAVVTLNSRSYTNKISLFLFITHMVLAIGLMGFLIFRGIQGLLEEGRAQRRERMVLRYIMPQVEAASFLSITLAFIWQKAFRVWPKFMVHFIIWSSFFFTLAAGIFLICFQRPATDGIGCLFIGFAIGN